MENSIIITYFKDDDYIFFEQYTKDAYLSNYDNEQSTFESYTDENGQEYLVHNTDHDHTFIWDNGKYIFEICLLPFGNPAVILHKLALCIIYYTIL